MWMKYSAYFFAIVYTLLTNIMLWSLRESLTLANAALIYVMVVVVVAVQYGIGPSWMAALLNFGGFNFFLVKPYYTFKVADPRELLDLVIFFIVAAITGRLAAYALTQAESLKINLNEQDILYKLTSTFNQASDKEVIYAVLKQVLGEDLHFQQPVILPDRTHAGLETELDKVYVLLRSDDTIYGTVAVGYTSPVPDSKKRLLLACVQQAAMALQRVDLVERGQRSKYLEEADRFKTTLLHAVSHDFRTPLTVIKTSTSNLLHLSLPESERLELLQTIGQESDHLNKLVGNLLDMSRLNAGAMTINASLNSWEEVAGDVAARVWEMTHQERIQITFPEDFPLLAFDYGLMLQALGNLVENSLRYEPPDRKIEIVGVRKKEAVHILVINHGPNIPPEEKVQVLEPFYHGKDGRVGLGLAIAKGIVEVHHGKLLIQDTPGGGVTFVIVLPDRQ